MIIIIY